MNKYCRPSRRREKVTMGSKVQKNNNANDTLPVIFRLRKRVLGAALARNHPLGALPLLVLLPRAHRDHHTTAPAARLQLQRTPLPRVRLHLFRPKIRFGTTQRTRDNSLRALRREVMRQIFPAHVRPATLQNPWEQHCGMRASVLVVEGYTLSWSRGGGDAGSGG